MEQLLEKLIRRRGLRYSWKAAEQGEKEEIDEYIEELSRNNECVKFLVDLFEYFEDKCESLQDDINYKTRDPESYD